MSNKKASIRLTGLLSPVRANPDAVQDLINDFFICFGDSKQVEVTLWNMFSGSISNAEAPTDATENGNLAFLYRMLLDLVRGLERYSDSASMDLPDGFPQPSSN